MFFCGWSFMICQCLIFRKRNQILRYLFLELLLFSIIKKMKHHKWYLFYAQTERNYHIIDSMLVPNEDGAVIMISFLYEFIVALQVRSFNRFWNDHPFMNLSCLSCSDCVELGQVMSVNKPVLLWSFILTVFQKVNLILTVMV